MFDNFDILYSDDFMLDELNRLGIVDGEVERLFYGEFHVYYPGLMSHYIIGYTGVHTLNAFFRLNMEENLVIIDEITLANGNEINEAYCRPTCRNDRNRS